MGLSLVYQSSVRKEPPPVDPGKYPTSLFLYFNDRGTKMEVWDMRRNVLAAARANSIEDLIIQERRGSYLRVFLTSTEDQAAIEKALKHSQPFTASRDAGAAGLDHLF